MIVSGTNGKTTTARALATAGLVLALLAAGGLAWLRLRGEPWERALADGAVRVTVDRQFSVAETPISNANEIALINTRPL